MAEQQKKTKSEKLEEKINALIEKIENEKDPNKRALYSIKASVILEKINEELELQEAKEKYESERQEKRENVKDEKSDIRNEILRLNIRKNYIKRKISEQSRYDSDSKNFILSGDNDEILNQGGIYQYLNNVLRTSGKLEQMDVADKIEQVENLKSELAQVEKDLQSKSNELKGIQMESQNDEISAKVKQTALVVKSKVNIFTKMRNFFKIVKDNVKSAWQERKKLNEIKSNNKIDMEFADEYRQEEKAVEEIYYSLEKERVNENYPGLEEKMEEIRKKYDKIYADIDRKYDQKKIQLNYGSRMEQEKISSERARTQAQQFRDSLKVQISRSQTQKEARGREQDTEIQQKNQDDEIEK